MNFFKTRMVQYIVLSPLHVWHENYTDYERDWLIRELQVHNSPYKKVCSN